MARKKKKGKLVPIYPDFPELFDQIDEFLREFAALSAFYAKVHGHRMKPEAFVKKFAGLVKHHSPSSYDDARNALDTIVGTMYKGYVGLGGCAGGGTKLGKP